MFVIVDFLFRFFVFYVFNGKLISLHYYQKVTKKLHPCYNKRFIVIDID